MKTFVLWPSAVFLTHLLCFGCSSNDSGSDDGSSTSATSDGSNEDTSATSSSNNSATSGGNDDTTGGNSSNDNTSASTNGSSTAAGSTSAGDSDSTASSTGGADTSGSSTSGADDTVTNGTDSATTTTSGSSTTGGGTTDGTTYSDVFTGGQFHLGPVDYAETAFHNSCAPAGGYAPEIQEVEGNFLAGLELTHNGEGQLCDACVELRAATGKSIVARVVTTGVTSENSIDLSPEAFAALDSGEFPRAMDWQVVKCPDTGNIYYQFQTEANPWWTSLWVRNARVPIETVEVQSTNHASWFALTRGSDGTYTDNGGFGEGSFTIRVTAVDGQTVEDTFTAFAAGDLVESSTNFQ